MEHKSRQSRELKLIIGKANTFHSPIKFKAEMSQIEITIKEITIKMGEHISLEICVSKVGEPISLGICVSQVGEPISLGICVSQVGEHISLGICVSQVGNTYH